MLLSIIAIIKIFILEYTVGTRINLPLPFLSTIAKLSKRNGNGTRADKFY